MAGRYATALFDLAREEKAIDAVKADLERFDALVAESADLNRLVRSPVFSAGEQLQALSAVLERAGIGGLAAKISQACHREPPPVRGARHGEGVPRAGCAATRARRPREVTVAEQLKDEHVAALRSALKAVSGKDIDLAVKSRSRHSSAGWWSRSAAAWSTPRCAPSSMRSSTR